MPKLTIGSVVRVHGFVMLQKLNDGHRYRVVGLSPYYGQPTYTLAQIGGKTKVRHYSDDVDLWIKDNDPDLNKIEVVSV